MSLTQNPAKFIFARMLLAACLLVWVAYTAQAQEATFRTYKDIVGFSCDFPSNWSFDQAKNNDRIFSSADARDATIIVQVIDQVQTAEKTATTQLEALKAQLLLAPDGRLLNEGTATVAGQKAPYLIASYTTKDTAGKLGPFRHIQMVVTTPRVFLLMSYSAPDGSFDQTLKVFQNCAATLKLEAADTPAPAANVEAGDDGNSAQAPVKPDPGNDDTLVWRHNADRGFWITVPSSWSKTIDDSEPYSVQMQHPDRVEGVIVFVVDMDTTVTVKDYADTWERVLAEKVFFMSDRLAVPQTDHPGVGLAKAPGIMREYQGQTNGATLRSVAAYVVNKKRGFTIVGYHFLGDYQGEKRVRAAVDSFRLTAPE